MTVASWEQVKELLHQAVSLEPEARAKFLAEVCAADPDLRAELDSLLSAEAQLSEHFMRSPLAGVFDREREFENCGATHLEAGQLFVQRFVLIRKLGEGGMGQVWLAEQIAPVRRPVALKLIRAGMYDETTMQRFEVERQSLAIMEHPGIAKVFDAGSTPQGQPYFVMEYVRGLPITEYCDQHRLKIRDRLVLFIQVCEAVQHAHQKAFIHRDLKPANILILTVDDKAVPRIIDFGLAKTTAPEVSEHTLFTRFGQFMGTPGYMSPEQVDPNIHDVDTRTDVYSLGAILYVLLTGLQPFETKRRQRLALDQWLRQLREDEPPVPSGKISEDREEIGASSAARSTQPRQLASELSGDLDLITMKALEKDRDRRYGAVAELAADVRRYLNDEPITARPASAGYQIRKYISRHRVAAAVTTALLLLMTAFSALQAIQLQKITHERDRANRERDRANRITDFTTTMFKVSNPSEARGNSITAREILDKASKNIDTGLTTDPELKAQMMYVMGDVYYNLGLYPRAQILLQQAMEIRQRILGPEHPDTLRSVSFLANVMEAEGDYAEAEKLDRETLDEQRRVLGAEHPDTLASMNNLANVLEPEGHYAEAEKLYRETLDIRHRVLGPEHPDTLVLMNELARNQTDEGHYAEAEKSFRETLDVQRRVLGPEHLDTLASTNNLAVVLLEEGHYAEAEKSFRETLEVKRRVLGPEHPNTAIATYNLGSSAAHLGRRDEALALLREAVDHGLPPISDLGIDKDPHLKSLHGDPRFAALVAHAKERAAAAETPK